jgi:hypothetical protein
MQMESATPFIIDPPKSSTSGSDNAPDKAAARMNLRNRMVSTPKDSFRKSTSELATKTMMQNGVKLPDIGDPPKW